MEKSRKIAAAVAGVFAYIRSEEEALAAGMRAVEPVPAVPPVSGPAPVHYWGMSGRQDIMHYRNLMQLRTFRGSKLR